MTSPARRERSALCDTFETVGPDAPTLCSPWRTRDLAAHLVIREGRPDAALGMFVPPLAERARRVQDGYAVEPWPELVERVRTGPPSWSPTRLEPVDTVVNLAEMFLHHEDVLRAAADRDPRPLPDDLEQGLWSVLTRTGRLLFRRSPVGVVLVTPTYGRRLVRTPPSGAGSVVLRGTPGELLLHASGRQRVARLTVEGPVDARAAFQDTDLSL
jgi:uncharacterized protein (TIGR03085 family)